MDIESEVIRQQMDETRTALTDKLEMLEHQVVETVQGASNAVNETVESVKDVVQETVQTVKSSVEDTVGTVKDTFDLKLQVERHPWGMIAGAATLGFIGGRYLMAKAAPVEQAPARPYRNGISEAPRAVFGPSQTASSSPPEPSLAAKLNETFHDEIGQLKGLAVGAAVGLIRDLVLRSVPETMGRQVEDAINGITVKLGGQPLGRIMSDFGDPSAERDEWDIRTDRNARQAIPDALQRG